MKTYPKLSILEKIGWMCINPNCEEENKLLWKKGASSSKYNSYYFCIRDAWDFQFKRNRIYDRGFQNGVIEGRYDKYYM